MSQWGEDGFALQGFFTELKERLGYGGWGYVPNAKGGFWGFWWTTPEMDRYNANLPYNVYLSFENMKLCFKLSITDETFLQDWTRMDGLKRLWSARIIAAGTDAGLPLVRPSRLRTATNMTVALVGEKQVQDCISTGGLLDMEKVLGLVHAAEAVLEKAVANAS